MRTLSKRAQSTTLTSLPFRIIYLPTSFDDESGIVMRPLMLKDHLRALSPSAESERERLHTGIEELDLELSLGDRSRPSNQLIQALLGDRAVTMLIYITSMACARRLSID